MSHMVRIQDRQDVNHRNKLCFPLPTSLLTINSFLIWRQRTQQLIFASLRLTFTIRIHSTLSGMLDKKPQTSPIGHLCSLIFCSAHKRKLVLGQQGTVCLCIPLPLAILAGAWNASFPSIGLHSTLSFQRDPFSHSKPQSFRQESPLHEPTSHDQEKS